MFFSIRYLVWLVLPGIVVLPGCETPPASQVASGATPEPFLEINGVPFSREAFESYMVFGGESEEYLSETDLVRSFVVQQVLLGAADNARIQVTDEELAVLTPESFPEAQGDTEELSRQLRDYLKIQKFLRMESAVEERISIQEVTDYYSRHADSFVAEEQLTVLEIRVPDPRVADRIRAELEPGNFRLFRETAMRISVAGTAGEGGGLGPFKRGELPARFEDVIFELGVGDISPVFRSEHGFHIFMVEERIPRHALKLYEVQDEIFDRLAADRERQLVEQIVQQLLASSTVYVFEGGGRKSWRYEDGL